jgi:hypothetical protein
MCNELIDRIISSLESLSKSGWGVVFLGALGSLLAVFIMFLVKILFVKVFKPLLKYITKYFFKKSKKIFVKILFKLLIKDGMQFRYIETASVFEQLAYFSKLIFSSILSCTAIIVYLIVIAYNFQNGKQYNFGVLTLVSTFLLFYPVLILLKKIIIFGVLDSDLINNSAQEKEGVKESLNKILEEINSEK